MRLCEVDGCARPHLARGFCVMHYHRWERHGDPLGGGKFRGEVQDYFYNVVMKYAREDCLLWPYSTDGYGYGTISFGGAGKYAKVHRLACHLVTGPPPSPDHEAAHNCGNGAAGCCNPNHLRWATRSDNQRDRIAHGTSNRGSKHGMSKLVEDDVLTIAKMKGHVSQSKLAKMYGVSQPTVASIHSGLMWSWLTGLAPANDNKPSRSAA